MPGTKERIIDSVRDWNLARARNGEIKHGVVKFLQRGYDEIPLDSLRFAPLGRTFVNTLDLTGIERSIRKTWSEP